jgi:competence protein ComEC
MLDIPKPEDCAVPVTVIDVFDRWRNGAYALYLDQNEASPQPHIRVETVAAHRGDRPWSRTPPPHVPRTSAGRANLPIPRILDVPSPGVSGQSSPGGQPAVAKPGNTAAADHTPSELRPTPDDDPGEDPQAAASDASDAQ